jgi:hypothetical protein
MPYEFFMVVIVYVVVFWVVKLRSLLNGYQSFGKHTASILCHKDKGRTFHQNVGMHLQIQVT